MWRKREQWREAEETYSPRKVGAKSIRKAQLGGEE